MCDTLRDGGGAAAGVQTAKMFQWVHTTGVWKSILDLEANCLELSVMLEAILTNLEAVHIVFPVK